MNEDLCEISYLNLPQYIGHNAIKGEIYLTGDLKDKTPDFLLRYMYEYGSHPE